MKNMNITMIFGTGIVIAVISVIVGGIKPEYGMLIGVCGSVLLLIAAMPGIEKLMSMVMNTAENAQINLSYVGIVIKASGISCISSVCSALCRDMGQTAIATKLELAGRIAIVLTSVPAINALLSLIERTV